MRDEQSAKLPVGGGTAPALPGTVHSRSAVTASLGGATASSAKAPATILDGASFKRKP